MPHQFLVRLREEGGFDVNIKVGEAFKKRLLRAKGSFDAGCHTNFSMKSMREKGGFDVKIKVGEAFEKLLRENVALALGATPISRGSRCTRRVALMS